jgi:hypothetical protein
VQAGLSQVPAVQTPLVQSEPVEHLESAGQPLQVNPPQSTSDSEPFWTPSLQVALSQVPAVQTPLAQSEAVEQLDLAGQPLQVDPPQSTSDSCWFFTLSEQVAGWQVSFMPQTRLRQFSSL